MPACADEPGNSILVGELDAHNEHERFKPAVESFRRGERETSVPAQPQQPRNLHHENVKMQTSQDDTKQKVDLLPECKSYFKRLMRVALPSQIALVFMPLRSHTNLKKRTVVEIALDLARGRKVHFKDK